MAMIITTMNDLPGYQIDEVLGEVFGLTVRARNIGSQFGASLKSLVGGELKGMTKMLGEGRRRDHRVPLRHLRAGPDVDRDLRIRHGRAREQAIARRAVIRRALAAL